MKKHKMKILIIAIVSVVLAGAWFLGGSPTEGNAPVPMAIAQEPPAAAPETVDAPEYTPDQESDETQHVINDDGSFLVTLTIRVDTLLDNMHLLDRDKHELVPSDGIIFPATQVTAYEGESVFNILQRETRRARVHMASRFTPGFNSAYVEAINNIYAYDAGALSGWMYSVNGVFPNVGSSLFLLSPGDEIAWLYSVDLGRDLGTAWTQTGRDDEYE